MMINLTQQQINFVGEYIEENLSSFLKDDDAGIRNIESIGLAATPCGHDCLDYHICFILRDIDKSVIPEEVDLKEFKLAVRRKQRPGIHKGLIDYVEYPTDIIRPGDSVSSKEELYPGTVGAIVLCNGTTCLLSCSHVLGEVGDVIVSPGMRGANNRDIGKVIASDHELDSALATIDEHACDSHVRVLNVRPASVRDVRLNDRVVKYGLATEKTHGMVTAIKGIRIGWFGIVKRHFLIEPDVQHPARRGEISFSSDSGSLWLSASNGRATTYALGINTAGDTVVGSALEYAFATEMTDIMQRFHLTFK